jgi:hypothetical protein
MVSRSREISSGEGFELVAHFLPACSSCRFRALAQDTNQPPQTGHCADPRRVMAHRTSPQAVGGSLGSIFRTSTGPALAAHRRS